MRSPQIRLGIGTMRRSLFLRSIPKFRFYSEITANNVAHEGQSPVFPGSNEPLTLPVDVVHGGDYHLVNAFEAADNCDFLELDPALDKEALFMDEEERAAIEAIELPKSVLQDIDQGKNAVRYLNAFDEAVLANDRKAAYSAFILIRQNQVFPRLESYVKFGQKMLNDGNHVKCWELYQYAESFLIAKNAKLSEDFDEKKQLFASLFPQMMALCREHKESEKALKIYRRFVELAIPLDIRMYEGLITATCTRGDFHQETFSILKQLESEGLEPTLLIYEGILKSCTKCSDLKTAHFVWSKLCAEPPSSVLAPGSRTVMHMLFLLGSIETPSSINSIDKPVYNIPVADILDEAARIFAFALERNMPITLPLLNSFLSVHTDQGALEKSLVIFREFYPKYELSPDGHAYGQMFQLFDFHHAYDLMKEFKEMMHKDNVKLISRKHWRSIVRIASYEGKLDEALQYMREMKNEGFSFTVQEMKLFHFRATEMENFEARDAFIKLCEPGVNPGQGKWPIWNERTQKVNQLLDSVYGRPAGSRFKRGVYHNMRTRVPGPSFPYIKDVDAEEFKQVEEQSEEYKKWKKIDDRKKQPPPQKRAFPWPKPSQTQLKERARLIIANEHEKFMDNDDGIPIPAKLQA